MEKIHIRNQQIRQDLQQPLSAQASVLPVFLCELQLKYLSNLPAPNVKGEEMNLLCKILKNTCFPGVILESPLYFLQKLRLFLLSFQLFAMPASHHARLSNSTKLENQKN